MKNMKKLLAMVLTVMMVLSMAITTSAAMEGELTGGSITIKDAVVDQTYSAYQILYLESYDKDADTYLYKANSAWAEWLATQTDYVNIDDQGYVTWKKGADVAEFAKLAQVVAETMTADVTVTAKSTTVEMTGLKLGYYLVDTTLGTLCSLDTTNPDVIMQEKNEVPTVEKEVKEDSTGEWGETNDAEIGQVVEYKATITVEAGAENYMLKDRMTEGLTFNNDVVVKIGDAVVAQSNYTVDTNVEGQTFVVSFDNEYIATLADDTKLDIYYSATLNENAIVGLPGNTNEVQLQYGEENEPSNTPPDKTITYTWDMKVVKYTVTDGTESLLDGATFKLSTDEAGTNVIEFHEVSTNVYKVCTVEGCTETHVTEITTDTTGTFKLEGLDAGIYYLTETKAPEGYNDLADPVKVEITGATEDSETKELTYTTVEKRVLNLNGAELPSTGGIGLTVFYVLGGVMVAAAVILLVTKKRMSIDE